MSRPVKYLSFLFLLQAALFGHAQIQPLSNVGAGGELGPIQPRTDIIAHSPEVEAMAKYGVLPVTLYSGTPQISVPIYELKTPSLSVPFSLSYNYNGFKPMEMSSWCGLGWSIQGGVGTIARIIKGQPDDGPLGVGNHYDDFITADALKWNQDYLTNIGLGQIDAEPDVYIFNAGGHSGKFVLIKGVAYLFPFQNLKITVSGAGFKMIDDKGNIYLFNDTETTYVKDNVVPNHTSAWQLSNIITADKKDTIVYTYNSYSLKQNGTYTDRFTTSTASGASNSNALPVRAYVNGLQINGKYLTSVVSRRYGAISFVPGADRLDIAGVTGNAGGKKLDKIVVSKPNGATLKEIVLIQDYYANHSQLKLKETFERQYDHGDPSKPLIGQHYYFEYQNETSDLSYTANANGLDWWGYNNGANNQMLFDQQSLGISYNLGISYANRNANSLSSSSGIISKITYPTGGYSTFNFEQNAIGTTTLRDGPGLRIQKISSYDNNNATTPAFIKQYTYYNGVIRSTSPYTPSSLHHFCAGYDDNSVYASICSALSDLSENQFFYREVTESTQDQTKTGKTIYTFDAQSSQLLDVKLTSQTEYKYVNVSPYYLPVKNVTNTYNQVTKIFFNGLKSSVSTVLEPIPIDVFGCTTMHSPDETQAADLNLIYGVPPQDGIYSLISDYSLLASKSETLTAYTTAGTTTLTTQTTYSYDNPDHLFPTKIVTKKSTGEQITQQLKYPLDYNLTSCVLPDAINTSFKNDITTAFLTLQTTYGNLKTALANLQPYDTHQSLFTSTASQYHCRADFQNGIKTALTHRDQALADYSTCLTLATTNNALTAWQKSISWMQLNNVVSPVIEKYVSITKSGSEYLLSATRNEYGILNSQAAVPLAIKQTEVSAGLLKTTFLSSPDSYYKPQLTFSFDADVNLVGQQKVNDPPITYLYGYKQIYPIAEIKNATFTDVLTALGLTAAQYKTESGAAIPSTNYLTKINALRQNLPNAMITTYIFSPLVGVTAVSDPNNVTTNYEYDDFNRLKFIKDFNQDIMKAVDYNYQIR